MGGCLLILNLVLQELQIQIKKKVYDVTFSTLLRGLCDAEENVEGWLSGVLL